MKRIVIVLLILVFAGCQQKEEPKSQYQFPTGPIQTQDDVRLLEEIVKKEPDNVNAWIKLGNKLMDTSRFNEAINAYQKALDIDPKNVDVRIDMGTCYRRIGGSERAMEEYRKALEFNPNHVYGHRNLAVVLAYDLRKNEEAAKEFEKYLELAPNAPDAAEIRQEILRLKAAK